MTATIERSEQSGPAAAAGKGGDRFVAGTLLLLAGILAVYQLIALHVIPPLAVFMALFGIMSAVVWRRRARWSLVVAAALAVVYLGGSFPFITANLAHPESPASFLAEAFLVIGLLALLVGAVGGLRGAGPGDRRPVAVGAVALAAVSVLVSAVAALGVNSDAQQPGDVPVEITRSQFPDAVEVPAGEAALWVRNRDAFHHTIVIEGTEVREALPASSTVRVPIELDPGTYRYVCDVPGHESMAGELHVR